MKIRAQVLGHSSRVGGKKSQTYHRLTLLDLDLQTRLLNTVDFNVTVEDQEKHKTETLQDRIVVCGVSDIRAGFSGRMELNGTILEVEGVKKA